MSGCRAVYLDSCVQSYTSTAMPSRFFVMVLFTVEYLRAESENGNLQREIGDSRREI